MIWELRLRTAGRDNGKLILDESKLNAAISTNLDGVKKLMTDKEHGIGVLLDNAVKAAANVSTGSPGSLVSTPERKAVLTTDNSLYQQLKSVSNTLANLNIRYEVGTDALLESVYGNGTGDFQSEQSEFLATQQFSSGS